MKKIYILLMIVAIVFSQFGKSAVSAEFSDVGKNYINSVNYLVSNQYAQGVTETKFGTQETIKRIDAAVMVARILKFDTSTTYTSAGFSDVPTDRQWAVNALANQGIINGKTETKFGSNESMTRSEMSKVLALAFKLEAGPNEIPFTDVSARFKEYVSALLQSNITEGKTATSFGANDPITRGEFSLFVYRTTNPNTSIPPEVISVD